MTQFIVKHIALLENNNKNQNVFNTSVLLVFKQPKRSLDNSFLITSQPGN